MSIQNRKASSQREEPNTTTPGRGRMRGGPMGHGPGSMMKAEKARDFKGTMRKLIEYLGKYKTPIVIVMILTVISNLFSIASPMVMGLATTKLFEGVVGQIAGTGTGIDFKFIGNVLLWGLALVGLSSLINFIMGWIMSGVSLKITYQFRKDISHKINRMPFKYFDSTSQGEVLSRITNDVDTVSQTLSQSLTQIINSVITLIGTLIMMFVISWKMTLIALLIVPFSLVVVILIVSRCVGD